MKWMNTQELVSILQRFPDENVEACAYLGCDVSSSCLWSYSTEKNVFFYTTRTYGSWHWNLKPSFFLRDDHEKKIAVRLVEELGILGYLEDIILESELNNVRVCEQCHHLMVEGWLVDDIRTFCSDECLRNAYPDINISELETCSIDDSCWGYWTKWEE